MSGFTSEALDKRLDELNNPAQAIQTFLVGANDAFYGENKQYSSNCVNHLSTASTSTSHFLNQQPATSFLSSELSLPVTQSNIDKVNSIPNILSPHFNSNSTKSESSSSLSSASINFSSSQVNINFPNRRELNNDDDDDDDDDEEHKLLNGRSSMMLNESQSCLPTSRKYQSKSKSHLISNPYPFQGEQEIIRTYIQPPPNRTVFDSYNYVNCDKLSSKCNSMASLTSLISSATKKTVSANNLSINHNAKSGPLLNSNSQEYKLINSNWNEEEKLNATSIDLSSSSSPSSSLSSSSSSSSSLSSSSSSSSSPSSSSSSPSSSSPSSSSPSSSSSSSSSSTSSTS